MNVDSLKKGLVLFHLKNCPYCIEARKWMEQLQVQTPAYADISITMVEESEYSDMAEQFDYYYVPTFYLNGEKIHEGAATPAVIRHVLDQALEVQQEAHE